MSSNKNRSRKLAKLLSAMSILGGGMGYAGQQLAYAIDPNNAVQNARGYSDVYTLLNDNKAIAALKSCKITVNMGVSGKVAPEGGNSPENSVGFRLTNKTPAERKTAMQGALTKAFYEDRLGKVAKIQIKKIKGSLNNLDGVKANVKAAGIDHARGYSLDVAWAPEAWRQFVGWMGFTEEESTQEVLAVTYDNGEVEAVPLSLNALAALMCTRVLQTNNKTIETGLMDAPCLQQLADVEYLNKDLQPQAKDVVEKLKTAAYTIPKCLKDVLDLSDDTTKLYFQNPAIEENFNWSGSLGSAAQDNADQPCVALGLKWCPRITATEWHETPDGEPGEKAQLEILSKNVKTIQEALTGNLWKDLKQEGKPGEDGELKLKKGLDLVALEIKIAQEKKKIHADNQNAFGVDAFQDGVPTADGIARHLASVLSRGEMGTLVEIDASLAAAEGMYTYGMLNEDSGEQRLMGKMGTELQGLKTKVDEFGVKNNALELKVSELRTPGEVELEKKAEVKKAYADLGFKNGNNALDTKAAVLAEITALQNKANQLGTTLTDLNEYKELNKNIYKIIEGTDGSYDTVEKLKTAIINSRTSNLTKALLVGGGALAGLLGGVVLGKFAFGGKQTNSLNKKIGDAKSSRPGSPSAPKNSTTKAK